jgi:FtsH-binding integral membrane protein
MDSLKRIAISASLLAGSAVASLLFIVGGEPDMLEPVKWGLYFPFYATVYLSSLLRQWTGVQMIAPVLSLIGVILSGLYLVLLLKKFPRNIVYLGVGVIFFVFLLIVGRNVFVRFVYIPHSTNLRTAVYSGRVFFEFLVGLVILYLILGNVDFSLQNDCKRKG